MKYRIVLPLTDDLIKRINNLPDGSCIMFSNTKGLKSNDFKKIKPSLKVRIIGGLDEVAKPKYNASNYYERTIYKTNDVVKILEQFEKIESHINPKWNDLEKAMYVYKTLCEGMEYDYNEIYGNDDKNRNLYGMLTHMSVCAGFAMIYKEFMDRLGIECDYQNRQHHHSWNVIKIDGTYYPIDLTWDISRKGKDGKCQFVYFGNDPSFFKNESHKGTDEMIVPANTFSHEILNNTLKKIENRQLSYKKETRYINKNGKEVIYAINKRNGVNQLFIIYDGRLKTVLYKNENDLNYLLDLDYSKGEVFTLNGKSDSEVNDLSKRVRIITRSDGSQLYVEESLKKEENDKNKFIIVKYGEKNKRFFASRIISEEKLATKSDDIEKERFISDVLLSDSRLSSKISRFGGYVGFVRKEMGRFAKFIDGEYEKKVSGIARF